MTRVPRCVWEPTSFRGASRKGFDFGAVIEQPGTGAVTLTDWPRSEIGALPIVESPARDTQEGGGLDLAQAKP